MTRVGFVPKPVPVEPLDTEGGRPTPSVDDDKVLPSDKEHVKPKVKTRVKLTFGTLDLSQIPQLVDVAGTLQDAGGALRISVHMEATNLGGLDETALELNVMEVLSQYGLAAEWEEG